MDFSPNYPVVPSHEYLELPPSCHPILYDGYKISPSLIAMVRTQSFNGRMDECSYAHLQDIEENCRLLIILGMTQNSGSYSRSLWGEMPDLVQPKGRESWRRLDKTEVWVQFVLLSCHQSDSTSDATAIIHARQWITWSSVSLIYAYGTLWATTQYLGEDAYATLCSWSQARKCAFHECCLQAICHVQDND